MSPANIRSFPVIRGKGRARRRSRSRFVPGLLGLEARALLSTLFVTNDNDSGTGSLRYELGAASAGDTIKFAPKADGTITLTSGPLAVATSVDIQGPGANRVTVSGGGTSEVFDVEGGVTATISGLAVADGSDTVPYAYGAGGILNQGTLTLSDVVVTGNSAGSEVFGAGGVSNFGTMTITDSTISGNTGGFGGGVNNNGPLSITGSTISGNSSGGGGGGIFSFASMSLTRSVVSGNAGGGIDVSSGYGSPISKLTVTDSSVVNNTNDRSASSFSQALGAGITAGGSTVTVSGSTISNNTAKGSLALGAGIFMGESPPLATSVGTTLTVKDSTFQGNRVIGTGGDGQGFGGAIHVDVSGAIAVSGSSFLDNTVTAAVQSQGGAIDLGGITSGTITGSLFSGNQAVVAGGTSPFGGSGTGGAISNEAGFETSVLTISGSTFTKNLAQGGPNGGFGLGGAIINQGNGLTLDLSSSLFVGNGAIGGAAGTIPGVTNSGGFGGGGALVNSFGAIASISGSTFIGNSAVGGAASGAGNQAGQGQGGAIQNAFATLTMTGSNLIGNRAVGGAASGGATAGAGQGGGLQDYGQNLQVSGGAILGNSAIGGSGGGSGEGGGVAISGGSASFSGVLIGLNSAIGGSGGGKGYGGGLYIATGALTTLTKTKVVANFASTSGDNVYGTYTNG